MFCWGVLVPATYWIEFSWFESAGHEAGTKWPQFSMRQRVHCFGKLSPRHIFYMPLFVSCATACVRSLKHGFWPFTQRSLSSRHVPGTFRCDIIVVTMSKQCNVALHDSNHWLAFRLKQMRVGTLIHSLITKYFCLIFILAYQIHIQDLFDNL